MNRTSMAVRTLAAVVSLAGLVACGGELKPADQPTAAGPSAIPTAR